jgi:hypothetical protein
MPRRPLKNRQAPSTTSLSAEIDYSLRVRHAPRILFAATRIAAPPAPVVRRAPRAAAKFFPTIFFIGDCAKPVIGRDALRDAIYELTGEPIGEAELTGGVGARLIKGFTLRIADENEAAKIRLAKAK